VWNEWEKYLQDEVDNGMYHMWPEGQMWISHMWNSRGGWW
jgi:hypothetical protein